MASIPIIGSYSSSGKVLEPDAVLVHNQITIFIPWPCLRSRRLPVKKVLSNAQMFDPRHSLER